MINNSMDISPELQTVLDRHPYLSLGEHAGEQYIGIVLNSDATIVSMYDFSAIPTPELRSEFLKLGEQWWWESNRQIPINLFYREEFKAFRPYLRHFAKDFELRFGHTVSLHDNVVKKVRRRTTTTLVRRPPAD